jgi:hypothetical protein
MWAIGCVLFEMLALRRAFQTASDIASRTLNPLPPDADAGLVALLEKLLSPDAESRPSAADALALPSVATRYADWPFAAWLLDGSTSEPAAESKIMRFDLESDTSRKCWAQHPVDGLWYLGQITSAIASTPNDAFMVHFAELDDDALCWHDSIKPFRQAPSAGLDACAPRSPASLKSGVVVGFGKADMLKARGPVPLEGSLSSLPDDFESDKSDTEDCASGGTSKRGVSGTAPRFSMLGRLLPSSFTDGGDSIAGIANWSGRTNQRSVGEAALEFSVAARRVAPAPTNAPAQKVRPNSAPVEKSGRKTPDASKRDVSRRFDEQSVVSGKQLNGRDSMAALASSPSTKATSNATHKTGFTREPAKKSAACAIL